MYLHFYNELCQYGATCIDLIQDYRCECTLGYTGQFCTQKRDSCFSNPCKNHGQCNYVGLCSCPDVNEVCGFHDELCQRIRCLAQVRCSLNNVSYICDCSLTTFTGDDCSIDIDECTVGTNTCKNSARCVNDDGGYSCDCAHTGYRGDKCDIDINECAGAIGTTRCRNGGTCINRPSTYVCICLDGWTGADCTSDIQECISSPCAHNSSCVEGVNGYLCACAEGFKGTNCNTDVDECQEGQLPMCYNGGACVNTVGGYYCVCPVELTGQYCERGVHSVPVTTNTSTTTFYTGSQLTVSSAAPQSATTDDKSQPVLVISLTLLTIALCCAVGGIALYRYRCIPPLNMKGSYRPDSMTTLPMAIQYKTDHQQMLI